MLLDLSSVEPGHFDEREFDVCICGAGVAGITLAQKLPQKTRVALLEGGGLDISHESQSVYEGNSTGQEYFPLDVTRLRYFGGTSNHWAGWCSPLEPRDFEASPYVERLGWPIKHTELEPYLREAADVLDVDFGGVENSARWVEKFDDFRNAGMAFSHPPTNLGEKYREAIEQSSNIWCYLNANLTDIALTDNLSGVKDVEVRDYGDGVHKVKARVFVLAAGGIENPRILLYCNSQLPQGIGNERGLVGKFFAEHPKAEIGKLLLEDDAKTNDVLGARSIVTPTTDLLRREQILSSKLIVRTRQNTSTASFKQRISSLVCRSDGVTDFVNSLRDEALWCPLDGNLTLSAEQLPNPSSYIKLGTDVDRFGKPRVELHWELTELDRESFRQAALRFAESFATSRLGRVRIADWLLSDDIVFPGLDHGEVGGHHHMCTTRMSDSPNEGVVDANLKVFGVDNLYVAGSSVFATTGHANPTLAISQLSLRLADRLKNIL